MKTLASIEPTKARLLVAEGKVISRSTTRLSSDVGATKKVGVCAQAAAADKGQIRAARLVT
jgi:hypothetical protein